MTSVIPENNNCICFLLSYYLVVQQIEKKLYASVKIASQSPMLAYGWMCVLQCCFDNKQNNQYYELEQYYKLKRI